jgi:hypothetical protein
MGYGTVNHILPLSFKRKHRIKFKHRTFHVPNPIQMISLSDKMVEIFQNAREYLFFRKVSYKHRDTNSSLPTQEYDFLSGKMVEIFILINLKTMTLQNSHQVRYSKRDVWMTSGLWYIYGQQSMVTVQFIEIWNNQPLTKACSLKACSFFNTLCFIYSKSVFDVYY